MAGVGSCRSDWLDVLAQRPDEPRELARDGGDDLVAVQAAGRERPEARAQAQLRAPGKVGDAPLARPVCRRAITQDTRAGCA